MRKIFKRLGVILAVVIALTCVPVCFAQADTGPKRSLYITVQNMPEEPYYFAILREGKPYHSPDGDNEILEEEGDQWISDLFYDYDEDGYCLFLYGGNASSIRYSETQIRDRGVVSYSYMVPRTFKVIVVTRSGKVTVSEPITAKAFNAYCIYDYADNSIVETSAALSLSFFIESAVCFLITLFVEGLILLFFGLFRVKNLPHFLVVNLVTQTLLFVFNLASCRFLALYAHYMPLWFLVEFVIMAMEVLWYRMHLLNKRGEVAKARNIVYGIVANVVSMFIDLPFVIFMVLMR